MPVGDGASTSKRARRSASKKVNIEAFFSDASETEVEDLIVAVAAENADGGKRKKSQVSRKASGNKQDEKADDHLKLLMQNPVACEDGQNQSDLMFKLDKHWPHPMESVSQPVNTNLLLITATSCCGEKDCGFGRLKEQNCVELKLHNYLSFEDYRTDYKKAAYFPADGSSEDELKRMTEGILKDLSQTDYYTQLVPKDQRRYMECGVDGKRKLPSINYHESKLWIPTNFTKTHRYCPVSSILGIDFTCEVLTFYYHQGKFYGYLRLDQVKPDHFPNLFPTHWHSLKNLYLEGHIRDGYLQEGMPKVKLTDTADFVEAQVPAGFGLQLRDYQLRSLTWMRRIEAAPSNEDSACISNTIDFNCSASVVKLQFGETGWYLDIFGQAMTRNPKLSDSRGSLRLKGGILADDTGSGKTITCLALIHSFPFDEERARWRAGHTKICLPFCVPSRATCIICPSNLHAQWIREAERCNPNFRIVGLSCIRDHAKYSWKDLILADIVIVTCQFFTNANYEKRCSYGPLNEEIRDSLEEKGRTRLQSIHFHRIIFDEIHELKNEMVKMQERLKKLSADSYWGVTGTPKFDSEGEIVGTLQYIGVHQSYSELFKTNKIVQGEFLRKFVKRNVPDLKLPPLSHEVVWVEASPSELALMNAIGGNRTVQEEIMMCSHYQIVQSVSNVVGDNFISIEDVKETLKKSKLTKMKVSEAKMKLASESLEALKTDEPEEFPSEAAKKEFQGKISRAKAALSNATSEFELDRGNYNFFVGVFKALERPDATREDCLICRDEIRPESITVLPCSHYFCYDCISMALKDPMKCPFCSRMLQGRSELMRIQPRAAKETEAEKLERKGLDVSKYGSKLIALHNYITELLDSEADARIILFLQYEVLAKFISDTLTELDIKHSRVHGNVFTRKAAIDKFIYSRDYRIIMLSSEDSVSGINLTQATHVILLHPFWTDQGEAVDLAWEKQGISRAYRGGLDHPLKVVRFAVKDTVEEELTLKRQGKIYS